ncbi:hypothetical protein BDQ17DRAFT_1422212 [Cyathus striatus]|nr:hypothetical protein BDQ17DRAFT_1422212 [Cyathus striatus]
MSHPLLSPPVTPTDEMDDGYLPPIHVYRTPSPALAQTPEYHMPSCSLFVAAPEPQDPTYSQPFSPLTPSSEDDQAASKLANNNLPELVTNTADTSDTHPPEENVATSNVQLTLSSSATQELQEPASELGHRNIANLSNMGDSGQPSRNPLKWGADFVEPTNNSDEGPQRKCTHDLAVTKDM